MPQRRPSHNWKTVNNVVKTVTPSASLKRRSRVVSSAGNSRRSCRPRPLRWAGRGKSVGNGKVKGASCNCCLQNCICRSYSISAAALCCQRA